MNLGDVLRGVGTAPLKDRTWTNAIVSTLNAILPTATALTAESTGTQALEAIATLPMTDRARLMGSEVDLLQGTLTLSTASDGSTPKAADKAEAFHSVVMHDLFADPRRSITIIMAIGLLLATLVMTGIMTVNYARTGNADTTLFTSFFHALTELLQAMSSNGGN